MDKYICTKVSEEKFAIYHAIYEDSNIFMRYDWNERMNIFSSNITGYFVYSNNNIIGGFTLLDNQVGYPFIVPPYEDRVLFWKAVLEFASVNSSKTEFHLTNIPEIDVDVLIQQFSATVDMTQRKMLRPTEASQVYLNEIFYFSEPAERDIPEIVETVFEAHSSGYTSKYKKPNKVEIEKAINMRFHAFSQTKSLHLSTMVINVDNNDLAGVCIAGIYPDSSNKFSTIHQVSVMPEYRRKGIAEAMMRRTISIAHTISPVITLGVMAGNPAEQLYSKLGFYSGPSYCNLTCMVY